MAATVANALALPGMVQSCLKSWASKEQKKVKKASRKGAKGTSQAAKGKPTLASSQGTVNGVFDMEGAWPKNRPYSASLVAIDDGSVFTLLMNPLWLGKLATEQDCQVCSKKS